MRANTPNKYIDNGIERIPFDFKIAGSIAKRVQKYFDHLLFPERLVTLGQGGPRLGILAQEQNQECSVFPPDANFRSPVWTLARAVFAKVKPCRVRPTATKRGQRNAIPGRNAGTPNFRKPEHWTKQCRIRLITSWSLRSISKTHQRNR